MRSSTTQRWTPPVSTAAATLAGIGVGLACFVLAIIVGILFAQWSVGLFLSDLSLYMLGEFLVMISLVVLTLGVPVAAYLRFQLLSPVVTLAAIVIFWFGLGFGQGNLDALFWLAAYAMWIAPFYVVVYLGLGGVEWYLRK